MTLSVAYLKGGVCGGGMVWVELPRLIHEKYCRNIFPNATLSVNRASHTKQYLLFAVFSCLDYQCCYSMNAY